MIRSLLILNPGSRTGNVPADAIRERLEPLGPVALHQPGAPLQIPDLIRRHGPDVDQIILGGGDGTINLALDALLEVDRPVGILPRGTANDLARSLDIPEDTELALGVILAGDLRRVDVARANDVTFINAVGIGLGPRMTQEMDSESKARWGVVAYLIGVARAIRGQRWFRARIESEHAPRDGHWIQITIANGIHYGGGMTIAEDARIDDGLLDVVGVCHQSRWTLLGNALRLRTGQTRAADNLVHIRCSRVSVNTDEPMDVTADGEFLTRSPLRCTVSPSALAIYATND